MELTRPSRAGRLVAAGIVLLTLVLCVLLLALGGTARTTPDASANLPSDAESFDAARVLAELRPDQVAAAVVVFDRGGEQLSEADLAAVDERISTGLQPLAGGEPLEPEVADDGRAVLVSVPFSRGGEDGPVASVSSVRDAVSGGLPDDVRAGVTSGTAVADDQMDDVAGLDPRYLALALALAALALALDTRSPVRWLAPFAVVVLADRVTVAAQAQVTRSLPLELANDGSTARVVSVVTIAVATSLAVLVLRLADAFEASEADRSGVRRVAVPVAGIGLATAGLLALLLVSDDPAFARVGLGGSLGAVVATLLTLALAPAVLASTSVRRGATPQRRTASAPARPALVSVVGLVGLAALALPLLGVRVGLSQAEQFRDVPDSIAAQRTLAQHFPGGAADPTTVAVESVDAPAVAEAVARVDGVAAVEEGVEGTFEDRGFTVLEVTIDALPGSRPALATVETLRETAGDVAPGALVGGVDAEILDAEAAAARDARVVLPLVAVGALALLLVAARSVVVGAVAWAASLLVSAAALGVGGALSVGPLGLAGLDLQLPVLAGSLLVVLSAARSASDLRSGLTSGPVVLIGAAAAVAAAVAVLLLVPAAGAAQLALVLAVGLLLDQLVVRGAVLPAVRTATWRSSSSQA